MASTTDAETAVRTYLQLVVDPSVLIDTAALDRLEQRIEATADPIDRIKAIAEYERAAHPDVDAYRDAFVKHAKAWAEANGIPTAAFHRMGVKADVLTAAGLAAHDQRRSKGRGRSAAPIASGHGVTAEQIAAAALKQRSRFTSHELADAAGGGSPMTIRKALQDLISSGKVRSLGPHPSWKGRGRAPLLYETVKD